MTLERKAPMQPGTPLRPMSDRRRAEFQANGWPTNSTFSPQRAPLDRKPMKPAKWQPAVPSATRDQLIARAGEGGWCEIQKPGICWGQGTDPSHRITTKSGGRHGEAKADHDRLSDILWACRGCHRWITDHPAEAKDESRGWALEEWQEPTAFPVLYRGRLAYLDDQGGVHHVEVVRA